MFILLTVEDKVRIAPSQFEKESQTIEDEIEKKYIGKVVLDAGLFISLFDVLATGDSYIYCGDGGAHLTVRFRMVVFKPFKGEVIEGTVKKSDRDYIQLSVGFFSEIYLDPIDLPNPSNYNEDENLWFWDWQDNQLFFEDGGRVRFKIDHIDFNPQVSSPSPAPKNINTDTLDAYALREHNEKLVENEKLAKAAKPPMVIKVTMREAGLGMVSWWTGQEEEEEGEGEEGEEQYAEGEEEYLGGDDENAEAAEEEGNEEQQPEEIEEIEEIEEVITTRRSKKKSAIDDDE